MEFLFVPDLSPGQRIRLSRIARRWRQVDLAAVASVERYEVSRAELDRRLRSKVLESILSALDLETGSR